MRRPGGTTKSQGSKRTARAEAAAWIVRLHGPHRSPELEAAFRDWLTANPENARQFEHVTEVWDAGATTPLEGLPRLPAHWREPVTNTRRWIAATFAVLLVAALTSGWYAWHSWAGQLYSTNIGEQRVVRLNDGSRVSLSSGTKVRIAYSNTRRRVELQAGEAYFEVAHDAHRPFIVTAGGHAVRALGTEFDVRHHLSLTAVTLIQGQVAVETELSRAASERRIVLSPGKRLRFFRDRDAELDRPSLDAITAWRRGEVILDKTPLSEAISELNRYDPMQLGVTDSRIAALPVSGRFRTGDSRGFAHAVAQLYGLDVSEQGNRIELRSRH